MIVLPMGCSWAFHLAQCAHEEIATCVAGSANPENIRKWAEWLTKPLPRDLLDTVLTIFDPVKNIGHMEGLPENN